MNCLAVMNNCQATRVNVSDFGIFWFRGEYKLDENVMVSFKGWYGMCFNDL